MYALEETIFEGRAGRETMHNKLLTPQLHYLTSKSLFRSFR